MPLLFRLAYLLGTQRLPEERVLQHGIDSTMDAVACHHRAHGAANQRSYAR